MIFCNIIFIGSILFSFVYTQYRLIIMSMYRTTLKVVGSNMKQTEGLLALQTGLDMFLPMCLLRVIIFVTPFLMQN